MTRQTEVDVDQLKADAKTNATLIDILRAAVEALADRMDVLEMRSVDNANAVVEGDEITPRAARNGKIKKSDQ